MPCEDGVMIADDLRSIVKAAESGRCNLLDHGNAGMIFILCKHGARHCKVFNEFT